MLKYKEVSFKKIDCCDLEQFIVTEYGHDYEFVADIECGNDSGHEFTVKKKPLSQYDQLKLDAFKAFGSYSLLARILLTDLVNRDKIPEGQYLISVCW